MKLTGIGVWAPQLRYGEPAAVSELAAELESLGYTAAWIPDVGGDVLEALDRLLDATSTMTIATGILNVWMQPAVRVAEWWAALGDADRGRVMLGLGVSHGALIGDRWAKPLEVMRTYLDELDAAGLPAGARCLAALGPKMLQLARDRSAGAHPYNVTVAHTAEARAALGPDAMLAPEVAVVVETDPDRARAIARQRLEHYVALPNYANNWRRLGYTDDEITSLADRLVDDLVGWGSPETIAGRIDAHRAAGADHVAIQVLTDTNDAPRDQWRALS